MRNNLAKTAVCKYSSIYTKKKTFYIVFKCDRVIEYFNNCYTWILRLSPNSKNNKLAIWFCCLIKLSKLAFAVLKLIFKLTLAVKNIKIGMFHIRHTYVCIIVYKI